MSMLSETFWSLKYLVNFDFCSVEREETNQICNYEMFGLIYLTVTLSGVAVNANLLLIIMFISMYCLGQYHCN